MAHTTRNIPSGKLVGCTKKQLKGFLVIQTHLQHYFTSRYLWTSFTELPQSLLVFLGANGEPTNSCLARETWPFCTRSWAAKNLRSGSRQQFQPPAPDEEFSSRSEFVSQSPGLCASTFWAHVRKPSRRVLLSNPETVPQPSSEKVRATLQHWDSRRNPNWEWWGLVVIFPGRVQDRISFGCSRASSSVSNVVVTKTASNIATCVTSTTFRQHELWALICSQVEGLEIPAVSTTLRDLVPL